MSILDDLTAHHNETALRRDATHKRKRQLMVPSSYKMNILVRRNIRDQPYQALLLGMVLANFLCQSRAATILPSDSAQCYTSSNTFSCSVSAGLAQLPVSNGIQGVKLFTSGPESITLLPYYGGSQSPLFWFGDFYLNGYGSLNQSIPLGTAIPVSATFAIGSTAGSVVPGWTATMVLESGTSNNQQGTCGAVSISGSGTGTTVYSGVMTTYGGGLAVANGCPAGPAFVYFHLSFNGASTSGSVVTVNVPSNSIDFGAAPVPEPSTAWMLGALICSLFAARRR